MPTSLNKAMQVLSLGGGLAGVSTARNIEKLFPRKGRAQITLVQR